MIIYIGIIIVLLLVFIYWKFFQKDIPVTNDISNFVVTRPIIKNNISIPKIIWSYWHDLTHVPRVVTKCIDTWIYHNTDYIINILDDSIFEELTGINIDNAFSITNNKTYQKKSDFIRLNIIYLYGGIWMDASMICLVKLDWLHNRNCEFIGYISPHTEQDPVIDSWFLAAIPKSQFIHDWLREFNKSLSYSIDKEYCDEMVSKYPVPKDLTNYLPYLTIHLCVWITTYNNPSKYKLCLESSTDVGAPFYYTYKNDCNIEKMYRDFKKHPKLVPLKLFKMTGHTRKMISKIKKRYDTDNMFINYVLDNIY